MMITNKTKIQDILGADINYVLEKLLERRIITERDHRNITTMTCNSRDPTIKLVDKIMDKGDTTCQVFLSMLRKPAFTDQFPDLKNQPWYSSTACVDFHRSGTNAINMMITNKTKIQDILGADINYVLNLVLEKRLITMREYRNLTFGYSGNSNPIVKLVDTVMYKGQTTCTEFLSILQSSCFSERFPDLKMLFDTNACRVHGCDRGHSE